MTVLWATRGDSGLDALERVQRSLTVEMIMTPRNCLMVCHRGQSADAVMSQNRGDFSFLPVVDETGRFEGLYRAEQWFGKETPPQQIRDDFEPISEDLLIGADASIVEFVTKADERPTRLVVSGDRIAGLVSLSDLQKLPVRAALFTLITSLEMSMSKRIEDAWPRDDSVGWLKLLCDRQRKRVLKAINTAKSKDMFVSEIACTNFSEKSTIILEKRLISDSSSMLSGELEEIRKLRNNIAHANYYAESQKDAVNVCAVVRTIVQIKRNLDT